jgi:putative flippase GtrA
MQHLLSRYGRLIRFGLVGLSGVVVNSAVLWALVRSVALAVPIASALATEAAIVSNFALNDRWTFSSARTCDSLWQRFLRFNGVSLGGLLITAVLLTLLTSYVGLPLLPANLLAVSSAITWNYVLNTRWTWRDQSGAPLPPADTAAHGAHVSALPGFARLQCHARRLACVPAGDQLGEDAARRGTSHHRALAPDWG